MKIQHGSLANISSCVPALAPLGFIPCVTLFKYVIILSLNMSFVSEVQWDNPHTGATGDISAGHVQAEELSL